MQRHGAHLLGHGAIKNVWRDGDAELFAHTARDPRRVEYLTTNSLA